MADDKKGNPLGLPTSAWKRLDPAGIVVVALFLGIPGLIVAGLSPLELAGVSCVLGILYFSWRCLEQWIGLQDDRKCHSSNAQRCRVALYFLDQTPIRSADKYAGKNRCRTF